MKKMTLIATVLLTVTVPVHAQTSATDHAAHHAAPAQAVALSDGEVRKVDTDAKKITIRHGPIANLDMPGMTMVFQVKEPAMLDVVKSGDKVKFRAEKVGGAYIVTQVEVVK
jgi:Cu(I)/Ag(I) efflux system protein CusF